MYAPHYRHRGLSAESMYAPHYRHRGLSAELATRPQQARGLGEDFQDFRSYLGTKTTHEMSVEAAVAAHKVHMDVPYEEYRVLSAESNQLTGQLDLLSEKIDDKRSCLDSLDAALDAMLAELKACMIHRHRLQERVNKLTNSTPQSVPWG